MAEVATGPGEVGSIARAADALLVQAADTIDRLTDEVYSKLESSGHGATIGKHMRHLLDHFAALLQREEGGEVAYDRRARGVSDESDRGAAKDRIAALRKELSELDDVQLSWPVKIVVMASPDEPEVGLESTVARELAFVTHHATHHLALMKPLARENGIELPAELGRAPSTIKDDRSQQPAG